MYKRRRKHWGRRRCAASSEDEDTEKQEEDMVKVHGARIYFHCDVTKRSILQLVDALAQASRAAVTEEKERARVTLFLHSPGGDVFAGLSGAHHIRSNPLPVTTVVDGFVASSATLLLLAGTRRAAVPHSSVLIHQLSTSFWGTYDTLLDEVANSRMLMASLREVYLARTRLSPAMLDDLLSKELHLSASTALENGVVEEVWEKG